MVNESSNKAARPEFAGTAPVNLARVDRRSRATSPEPSSASSSSNAFVKARFSAGWPTKPSGERSGEREGKEVRSVVVALEEAEWRF
jgi:hypothetical protein